MPCPPYATLAASFPDETLRPTVARRPLYLVTVRKTRHGFVPTHLYVRRFWSAVLGAGAVADLMRIVQAGLRGNSLRRPVHLPLLLSAGLVRVDGNMITVRDRVPRLHPGAVALLGPTLRQAHSEWFSPGAKDAPQGNAQGDQLTDEEAGRDSDVGRPFPKRHRPQTRRQPANPGTGQLAS